MLLMPLVFAEAKLPAGQLKVTDMRIHSASPVLTPISLRLPRASGVPVIVMKTDQVPLKPRSLVVPVRHLPAAVKHGPLLLASAAALPLLALLLPAVFLLVLR